MAFIISNLSATLFHNGKIYTVPAAHPNFDAIVRAIRESRFDDAVRKIDLVTEVKKFIETDVDNALKIENGTVYYNGTPVHNSLTDRILRMMDEGFDATPMIRFLHNLMQNPSNTAINELYGFLEKSQLPITEDGHFLAYKRVRSDYMDCHSGTIRNMVGDSPSMPRNAVDDNRNNTCSNGLHFASLNYLRHFEGPRLMVLDINPRDVVSIPADYNDSKGRCCGYLVYQEIDMPSDFTTLENRYQSVWIPQGNEQEPDEEDYEGEDEDEDENEDEDEDENEDEDETEDESKYNDKPYWVDESEPGIESDYDRYHVATETEEAPSFSWFDTL